MSICFGTGKRTPVRWTSNVLMPHSPRFLLPIIDIIRSRSTSRALQSWKSGHFQKLFPPPFTMEAGSWPRILKLGHNSYIRPGRIFDTCPSFCVTWLRTWQKRQLRRVDRQSGTGQIYRVLETPLDLYCMVRSGTVICRRCLARDVSLSDRSSTAWTARWTGQRLYDEM